MVIGLTHVPERRPGTDITPTAIERDYRPRVGMLHDRIVDTVRATGEERLFVGTDKIEVWMFHIHRAATGLINIAGTMRQCGKVAVGAEQEHTAIPDIVSVCQVACCGLGIRFLNKLCELSNAGSQLGTAANIAISGFGFVRYHTKRHQSALGRCRQRGDNRGGKSIGVPNEVICR